MRHFPLCSACRAEYEDPGDRRFHAEPNACPVCGPRVTLLRLGGPPLRSIKLAEGTHGDPAGPVRAAAELLGRGEILALKGLGGFHLACDATDAAAVRRLKQRKRRPHKPLAVMFESIEQLRAHCLADEATEVALASPEHPIVLLPWREIGPDGEVGDELGSAGAARAAATAGRPAAVDPEVATGQRYVGAMLPYTPLHILLLRAAGRPLVMTSGNLAEEPIVKGWEDIARLMPIADAFLVHDREIAVRYDDSVVQVRADACGPFGAPAASPPSRCGCPAACRRYWPAGPSSRTRSASRARPTPSSASTSATSRTWRRWTISRRPSPCTAICSGSSRRSWPTTFIRSTWPPSTPSGSTWTTRSPCSTTTRTWRPGWSSTGARNPSSG